MVWYQLDHLVLRAALAGKIENAALLAGFADGAHTARRASRQANEARAYTRLQALLRERAAPDELERLLAEGAKNERRRSLPAGTGGLRPLQRPFKSRATNVRY